MDDPVTYRDDFVKKRNLYYEDDFESYRNDCQL
jgi:hypothetical protein